MNREALARKRRTCRGPEVRSRKGLQKYLGWQSCPEPLRAWRKHNANEPLQATEARLCAETARYLYTRFTPTRVRYSPGSRPMLEALLNEIILREGPRPGPEALAFRIFDWVFENVRIRVQPRAPVWRYYGTDEDIAMLRVRVDCYCVSRLMATLLQIGGIPARLNSMFHLDIRSMHSTVEAHLDGAWRFFDPSCHDYAVTRSGALASLWEIITDPFCQTEGVREDRRHLTAIRDPGRMEYAGIQNYPLAESTAHCRSTGSAHWWGRDPDAAARTGRFGF